MLTLTSIIIIIRELELEIEFTECGLLQFICSDKVFFSAGGAVDSVPESIIRSNVGVDF